MKFQKYFLVIFLMAFSTLSFSQLIISGGGNNTTCFQSCDGSTNVTVTGGSPPYVYLWDNGATTLNIMNLCAGTYELTATDAELTVETYSVIIQQPIQLAIDVNLQNNVCAYDAQGQIEITPNGGTPGYSYNWPSLGSSNSLVSGLPAGDYGLTVMDMNNCQVDTNITVMEPIPVAITTDSMKLVSCSGQANAFVAVSGRDGVTPYSYVWSSGGTAMLEANLALGTYSVTVTDANGCSANANYPLTNLAPIDINYEVSSATAMNFTPSLPDFFNSGYWNFGDGNMSEEKDPTHDFGEEGIYNVCVTVIDTVSGCQRMKCDQVTVGSPSTACLSEFTSMSTDSMFVHFNNISAGNFTQVHWNFGDGQMSTDNFPSHEYQNPGAYNVCLSVFNNTTSCQDTYCSQVMIENQDTTVCSNDFTFAKVNDTVFFQNQSISQFSNFHWNFGDGTVANTQNTNHHYAQPGHYQVCFSAYDIVSDCQASICKTVFIAGNDSVNCNAEFSYQMVTSNGVDVMMNPIPSGNVTDYFWNLGNGVTSYVPSGVIAFPGEGVYDVCLTVLDSVSGCVDTYCDQVIVTDSMENYCSADFGVFVEDMDVSCVAQELGTVTGYMWSYGNGDYSDWENPLYTYDQAGVYNVCLTVFDEVSQCIDTHCESVNISPDVNNIPCSADFSWFVNPNDSMVHFQPITTGNIVSYYWSMGNNTPSVTMANPVYDYPEDGYYEVCLTVTSASGCQSSVCKVIGVGDLSNACYADFQYFEDNITSTAHFNNESLGNIEEHHWTFGDGMESFQVNPSHTYAAVDYYAACLVVSNTNGCEDVKCKEVRVGNALENPCQFSCVWPGDANNDLEANHYDLITIGLNYGETGPVRDSVSTMWMGHFGQDWSTFQWDGVNNKHGDCDGNGEISIDDVQAVQSNFAYSHPYQMRSESGEPLSFVVTNPNVNVGEDIEIAIMAGDTNDISLYGIGFELQMDPTKFDFSTLEVTYTDSWLGDVAADMITFDTADVSLGKIFIAESKKDQIETIGKGEIARLTIRSIGIDEEGTDIILTTVGGLDLLGDTVDFNANDIDSVIINSVFETEFESKPISVYPNPAQDQISFNMADDIQNASLVIYNAIGKEVLQLNNVSGGYNVITDLSSLSNGVYLLRVKGDQVFYESRFTILK